MLGYSELGAMLLMSDENVILAVGALGSHSLVFRVQRMRDGGRWMGASAYSGDD